MLRKLYHGSKDIIQKPVYGYGKKYNDYGLGFYCTEDINMAKEWAATSNQNGYANCYELDCSDLKILNLNATRPQALRMKRRLIFWKTSRSITLPMML